MRDHHDPGTVLGLRSTCNRFRTQGLVVEGARERVDSRGAEAMWTVTGGGGGNLNNKQAQSFAEAGESLAEAKPSSDTWCLRCPSSIIAQTVGVPRWLESLLLQRRLD